MRHRGDGKSGKRCRWLPGFRCLPRWRVPGGQRRERRQGSKRRRCVADGGGAVLLLGVSSGLSWAGLGTEAITECRRFLGKTYLSPVSGFRPRPVSAAVFFWLFFLVVPRFCLFHFDFLLFLFFSVYFFCS
jgi:hypothetical protein